MPPPADDIPRGQVRVQLMEVNAAIVLVLSPRIPSVGITDTSHGQPLQLTQQDHHTTAARLCLMVKRKPFSPCSLSKRFSAAAQCHSRRH